MKKFLLLITLLIFTAGIAQNAPISFEPGEFGNTWTWTVFENDDDPALEVVANPDPSGINTSATVAKFTARDAGNPWAGVESMHGSDLGTFDLTTDNALVSIMVWKTKISDIGIKFATPPGGAQPELKVANTLINQWEEITIDFTGYIGLGETTGLDQIIIFPDFIDRTADDIIYFDNISFGPAGTSDLVELPVDFESTTADYALVGFEGADSAVEPNPDMSGENTSATVVRTTKTVGAQFFAGTAMGLDTSIDFSVSEMISIKTWSPKAGIPVRLKLEAVGGAFVELDAMTTLENQWETLTWDFTGQTAGIDFTTVIIFFEFVVDLPGDGSTYYYDDIEVETDLGLDDNELQSVISYPNPTQNVWNIRINNHTIDSIQIVDVQGRIVIDIYPNASEAVIDAISLPTGMYFSRVNTSVGTKTIKLIKE